MTDETPDTPAKEEVSHYKDSSLHGIEMMRTLLPSVKQFVTTVKTGLENPNLEAHVPAPNVVNMKTGTLRVVAEKMEEFAANLGKVAAFIRLATNRFGPETLEIEKKLVEKILTEINSEQVTEISRYMDRNYIGRLDHERGAVVSGRYVGAIPRIKDALSLLVESLESAETLLINEKQQATPSLAEQTFGEEAEDLFRNASKVSPFDAMGGVFSPKPVETTTAAPALKAVSEEDEEWFGLSVQKPFVSTTNEEAPVPVTMAASVAAMATANTQLAEAITALNEVIVTYMALLKATPDATHLASAIKALETTKSTLSTLEKP